MMMAKMMMMMVMMMLQDAGSSASKRKSGKFREEVFMAPVLGLQAPEWCHNWIFLLTCNSNKNFVDPQKVNT